MNLSTSNIILNPIRLKFLFFYFFIFVGVSGVGAQQDKIAILYLHASDLTADQLYTKEQLENHFLTESSPVKRFWTEQSAGRYSYEGKVFMVPIDRTEQELKDRISVIKSIFGYSSMDRVLDLDYADYLKEKERKEKNKETVTSYESDDLRWKSINLAIPGYEPDKYTKTILLFGSSGFGKLQFGRSNFSSKENGAKIKVGGVEYPSDIGYVDAYYFSTALMEASSDLGLLHVDKTMLHEWGHTFGVIHSGYLLTDSEPMQGKFYNFATDYDPTTYGNKFDIMGDGEYALHFNAYFKFLTGWISGSEKREVKESTSNISLMPLEGTKGIRAVEIKCPGMLELPKKEYGSGMATVPGKQPASLFIEYRSGIGFDKNLLEDNVIGRDLSVNTKGLLINLAFPDFNEKTMTTEGKNFSLGSNPGDVYKKNVSLLDMSPDNNRTNTDLNRAADNHDEASLIQGNTFYNDQLQVAIGNVRLEGGGVLFDVELEKKPGVISGVYTTALFSNQSITFSSSNKILYSPDLSYYLTLGQDGNLVIKKSSDDSQIWKNDKRFDELAMMRGGGVTLKKDDIVVWSSTIGGDPKAKLIINNDGALQVLDNNNAVIWPKTYSENNVRDKEGNIYRTAVLAGKTWTMENMNYQTEKSFYQESMDKYGRHFIASRFYIQSEAIQACKSLGADWRLPTYEDFKDLVKIKYPSLEMDAFISAPIEGINEIYPLGGYTGSYKYITYLKKTQFSIVPIKALWLNDRYLFLNGGTIEKGLLNSSGTGRQSSEFMFPCRCVKD